MSALLLSAVDDMTLKHTKTNFDHAIIIRELRFSLLKLHY
jgi:hypothetical protein